MRAPDDQRDWQAEDPVEEVQPRKGSAFGQAVEFVVMLVIAFVLAQVMRTYVVQPFVVPTGSMLPTIQLGDHVLANKFIYRFGKPRRGDVVVLDDPTGRTPMLIKRVVAIGGDAIDVRDGRFWLNGRELDEPYTHGLPTEIGNVPMPLTLPPDTVWVMGDNRTGSSDSRVIGPQPVEDVHGMAFVVYWPLSRLGASFGP